MPKKKPSVRNYWKTVIRNLEAERDAALAGQLALKRRFDAEVKQVADLEGYAARLRAEHDKAMARIRSEHEGVVLRYATRENELRENLKHAMRLLAEEGWTLGQHNTWIRAPRSMPEPGPVTYVPPMAPLQPDPARHEAAMLALRATPFGFVACKGIVDAIEAYISPTSSPRCGSAPLAADGESPWSAPAGTPTRDR